MFAVKGQQTALLVYGKGLKKTQVCNLENKGKGRIMNKCAQAKLMVKGLCV